LNHTPTAAENAAAATEGGLGNYARSFGFSASPLVLLFPLSIINNVFALIGVAGIATRLRELIISFFAYNLLNVVVSFHVFIDQASYVKHMKSASGSAHLSGFESAAAAFLFFDFILSLLACAFGMKALDELKERKGSDAPRGSLVRDDGQV
jgi:hypothetical protein